MLIGNDMSSSFVIFLFVEFTSALLLFFFVEFTTALLLFFCGVHLCSFVILNLSWLLILRPAACSLFLKRHFFGIEDVLLVNKALMKLVQKLVSSDAPAVR